MEDLRLSNDTAFAQFFPICNADSMAAKPDWLYQCLTAAELIFYEARHGRNIGVVLVGLDGYDCDTISIALSIVRKYLRGSPAFEQGVRFCNAIFVACKNDSSISG
jgi:hypothetical protein